jgi:hypothetical protein
MNFFKKLYSYVKKNINYLEVINQRLDRLQESIGRIEAKNNLLNKVVDINKSEFRVFSQNGEDGIIENLINLIDKIPKTFIEFGVQNYDESNTRFLLMHRGWSGLILDGSSRDIESIKKTDLYWRHNLIAVNAFITRSNINEIFLRNNYQGEIGLLSIDIDGNDYWIWDSINVVNPMIVIIEYNARFGPIKSVTIPYSDNFNRMEGHWSMIYYGASLSALCKLGESKGYAFVGCNSSGNNAFFIRKDKMPEELTPLNPREGFIQNKFREARDKDGNLSFMNHESELSLLNSLELVEV